MRLHGKMDVLYLTLDALHKEGQVSITCRWNPDWYIHFGYFSLFCYFLFYYFWAILRDYS